MTPFEQIEVIREAIEMSWAHSSAEDLALPLTYEVHSLSTGFSAIVYDANGQAIDTHLHEEQASAIVRACNSHRWLVEALEQISTQCGPYSNATVRRMARIADAALSLAKGE